MEHLAHDAAFAHGVKRRLCLRSSAKARRFPDRQGDLLLGLGRRRILATCLKNCQEHLLQECFNIEGSLIIAASHGAQAAEILDVEHGADLKLCDSPNQRSLWRNS